MTFSKATAAYMNSDTGLRTFSIAPSHVGDIVILHVTNWNTPSVASVTSVASSNITWASTPQVVTNDPWSPSRFEIWIGVATSTASATVTVNYSAAVTSNWLEYTLHTFTGLPAGETWQVTSGLRTQATYTTTVICPSVTATKTSIYWCIANCSGTASGGSPTTGWTYANHTDTGGIRFGYNIGVAAGSYAPTWTQNGASGLYAAMSLVITSIGAAASGTGSITATASVTSTGVGGIVRSGSDFSVESGAAGAMNATSLEPDNSTPKAGSWVHVSGDFNLVSLLSDPTDPLATFTAPSI